MRLVIALGGNALLRRGEAMTAENQRDNVRIACEQIAKVAPGNELVVAHGNGPQVGLLALQGAAYDAKNPYPLDVLGAETEGMIGYMIEQELGNLLPVEVPFATLLTQVEVDPNDPAFQHMTKPIGPVYPKEEAEQLAAEKGWTIAPDGDKFRRVVAMPHAKWGETPCAFVTPRDGSSLSAEEVIVWCQQHLARFKVPGQVVFASLPKTSTGKVQKFLLREQARALAERLAVA